MLAVRVRITFHFENVTLGQYLKMEKVFGESNISSSMKISRILLKPPNAKPLDEALKDPESRCYNLGTGKFIYQYNT